MYGEAAEEYEELVRDYPEKEELNYYLGRCLDASRRDREGDRGL